MSKLVLLASYLCLLPCIIIALAGYLVLITTTSTIKPTKTLTTSSQFQLPPPETPETSYIAHEKEARVEVLTEFFKRYSSPLAEHAQLIVDSADKYSLDWRLIPAIAMQESTLCKKIPKNSYNCWGFGIYGGKITKFNNYSEAIETVTKTLAKEYKEERGLAAPHEIVTRYTPGNTTWADKVSLVMDRIQSNL